MGSISVSFKIKYPMDKSLANGLFYNRIIYKNTAFQSIILNTLAKPKEIRVYG